jgi:hypothetical protein
MMQRSLGRGATGTRRQREPILQGFQAEPGLPADPPIASP